MNRLLQRMVIFLSISLSSANLIAGELTSIPFTIDANGQMIVQVFINQMAHPFHFVFSTCERTTIWKDQKLTLFKLKVDTIQSKAKLKSFNINGQLIVNKTTIDWKKKNRKEKNNLSKDIIGTIGSSILRHYIWQIDYKTKMIRVGKDIADFNIPDGTPSTVFTSSFLNYYPTFDISSDILYNKRVFLSTNSAYGLLCSLDQGGGLIKEKLSDKNPYENKSKLSTSLSSPMTIQFENLELNNLKLSKADILFSDVYFPSIGRKFLKDYLVTIDYLNKMLYLEPQTDKGKEQTIIPERK